MKHGESLHYVYLGRGGGGGHDLINLVRTSNELGYKVKVWIAADLDSEIVEFMTSLPSLEIFKFRLPRRTFRNTKLNLNLNVKCLIQFMRLPRGSKIFFVMASPYDWILHVISKRRDFFTIMLVHEIKRNEGDIWPLRRSIHFRVKHARKILCYSKTVSAEVYKTFRRESEVICVPEILDTHQSISDDVSRLVVNDSIHRIRVGFIGRAKPYKGFEVISKIERRHTQCMDFYMLGHGMSQYGKFNDQLIILDSWFNHSEIISLIRFIDVFVFPYKSGSQSGLVPTVKSHSKWIIASDEASFVEQLAGYEKAILLSRFELAQLFDTILNNLPLETIRKSRKNSSFGRASESPFSSQLMAFLTRLSQ